MIHAVEIAALSVVYLLAAGLWGHRWNRRIHGTTPRKGYRYLPWVPSWSRTKEPK